MPTLTRAQLIMVSHGIEGPMKKNGLAPARGIINGLAIMIGVFLLIGLGYFIWLVYF